MRDFILNELKKQMQEIGNKIGFNKLIVKSNKNLSEIYIMENHALQLEIDWRENNLFMYAVYLKDKKLPTDRVIYRYDDGQWCRKYVDDIYNTKHYVAKDKNKRYSIEYLFDCFDYYSQLINNDPIIFEKIFE